MSTAEHRTYVTAPTGWHHELIRQYAEHVLYQRGAVPDDCTLTARLLDCEGNSDHTTTWRVHYDLRHSRNDQLRPLSLNPQPEKKRPRQRRLH